MAGKYYQSPHLKIARGKFGNGISIRLIDQNSFRSNS